MRSPEQPETPPGGKRERNKAENRAAILAAARRVFADLGYEAATIRDVIGATDLAAGTFYNYFRDKESVLRALLDAKMGEMQQRGREARRDAATVEEVVRATIGLSFAMLAEDREVFDLLHRNAGAIRAILDEPSFVANREDLRRDLERALRAGGNGGIDAEYLTAAISGLAFEVAACAADRNSRQMKAAADFASNLVLGGIASLGRSPAKANDSHPGLPASRPRATGKTAAANSQARRANPVAAHPSPSPAPRPRAARNPAATSAATPRRTRP